MFKNQQKIDINMVINKSLYIKSMIKVKNTSLNEIEGKKIVKKFLKDRDIKFEIELAKKIIADNHLEYFAKLSILYPERMFSYNNITEHKINLIYDNYNNKKELVDILFLHNITIVAFLSKSIQDSTLLEYIYNKFKEFKKKAVICYKCYRYYSDEEIRETPDMILLLYYILENPNFAIKDKITDILKYRFMRVNKVLIDNYKYIPKDDYMLLGNIATINNYPHIFFDCVTKGYMPTEEIFYKLVSNINAEHLVNSLYWHSHNIPEKLPCAEPYKILNYCASIFKYVIDVKKVNIITNNKNKNIDFNIILNYCVNVDYDFAVECYKNGVYIDIATPNLNLIAHIETFYHLYYENVVEYILSTEVEYGHAKGYKNYKKLEQESEKLVLYLNNNQVIFREKFKYSSFSDIKKYYAINKTYVFIDQYCINNAYLLNNNKVLDYFLLKDIYPTHDVLLKYVKIKAKGIYASDITNIILEKFVKPDLATLAKKIDISL